jgi:hypothetical protein
VVELIFNWRAEDQYPGCLAHLWTAVNQSPGKANEICSPFLMIWSEEAAGSLEKMRTIILQGLQKGAKGFWVVKLPDFHGSTP